MTTRMSEAQFDRNFAQFLKNRAANLSARGAELKKLQTHGLRFNANLDDAQKRRTRVLGVGALHGLREGMEARRTQMEDDEMGDTTGAGPGESSAGRD